MGVGSSEHVSHEESQGKVSVMGSRSRRSNSMWGML